MRLSIIIFTTLLLITNSALAAETAYVTNQRFMPLAPRTTGSTVQHPLVAQPTKFLPLTQSRFPMPIKQANIIKNDLTTKAEEDKIVAENFPEKIITDKKIDMSQEQAKQLLSIFAETQ